LTQQKGERTDALTEYERAAAEAEALARDEATNQYLWISG
jgi:hypothetical protein